MADIYNMTDTWNDAGVTFSAIKMDVTDTASAAGSNLLDLQVGGVSRFRVQNGGAVYAETSAGSGIWLNENGTQTAVPRSISFMNDGDRVAYITASRFGGMQILTSGVGSNALRFSGDGFILRDNGDVRIHTDAAHAWAQRQGTNAQTFNIYNTYTDASNYERGFLRWNSNVLEIGTEEAGTGVDRNIKIMSPRPGDPTLLIDQNGFTFYRYGHQTRISSHGSGGEIETGTFLARGGVTFSGLPTTDPAVSGQLWNDAGTLKISAGV